MSYQTTIRRKGQVTIPKEVLDILKLEEGKKLQVEVEKDKRKIVMEPAEDFLEFARKIKVKRKIDPVKAREYMEKHYERL